MQEIDKFDLLLNVLKLDSSSGYLTTGGLIRKMEIVNQLVKDEEERQLKYLDELDSDAMNPNQ